MIRVADDKDMTRILEIFSIARSNMKKNGNPNQWGDTHPAKELVVKHMNENNLYVDEVDGVVQGVCALVPGLDDTYEYIEDGQWINDEPYITMHMVASSCEVKGVFERFCNYAKTKCGNIRIDTHEDNKTMRHCIAKQGFKYCGVIYVRDHSPRFAYQWCGLM